MERWARIRDAVVMHYDMKHMPDHQAMYREA